MEKALHDAKRCIAIKPDFAKGYNRQCIALFHSGDYVGAEASAQEGLKIDSANAGLLELLKQCQVETAETPDAQAMMYKLREEKRNNEKMNALLKGLNMGGPGGPRVFSPGAGGNLDDMMKGLQGGGGGGGFGNLFGGGKPSMTEAQMRTMSRGV